MITLHEYFYNLLYDFNEDFLMFSKLSESAQEKILKELKNTYELCDSNCFFVDWESDFFIEKFVNFYEIKYAKSFSMNIGLSAIEFNSFRKDLKGEFREIFFWHYTDNIDSVIAVVLENKSNKI